MHLTGRFAFIGMLLLAATGRDARGQSPAERGSIERFRDSVAAITEPAALRVALSAHPLRTRGVAGDLERIRRGWLLLQLGKLTDSTPAILAATTEFYEAGVRHANWPTPWFGLGSAKLTLDALGARESRSAHQSAGTGWRPGAISAFLAAYRADPDFAPAGFELAKTALRDPNGSAPPEVGDALWRAVRRDSADGAAWLLLGRFQRQSGARGQSLKSFSVAASLDSDVRGQAFLELARESFASGDTAGGEAAYYAGSADSAQGTVDAYLHDLASVADSGFMRTWASASPDRRVEMLKEFWHSREFESGRPSGTRLAEHYRRWEIAWRSFRLIPAWTRQYEFGMPFRSGSDELDDRGVIYVRHGAPDETVSIIGGEETEPNVSWLYYREDGNLIFHFKLTSPKYGAVSGWRAIESLGLVRTGPGYRSELIASRVDLDPVYLRLMSGSGSAWADERLLVRASLARGTTTDSDPLRFDQALRPILQVFGLGTTTGGEALVVVAIPTTSLPAGIALLGGDKGYVFRLRLTSADARMDSTVVVRLRTAAPTTKRNTYLSFLTTFPLPSGDHRIRVIVSDSSGEYGATRIVDGVPVIAAGNGLAVGDIVVGSSEGGLAWSVDGRMPFPLNPRNAWTTSETLEMAFQLWGLPAGTPIKVRIAIRNLAADSTTPPRASVEFDRVATGDREVVSQSIGLNALRPGRYLLTVTVTAGDRSVRRERRITVVR